MACCNSNGAAHILACLLACKLVYLLTNTICPHQCHRRRIALSEHLFCPFDLYHFSTIHTRTNTHSREQFHFMTLQPTSLTINQPLSLLFLLGTFLYPLSLSLSLSLSFSFSNECPIICFTRMHAHSIGWFFHSAICSLSDYIYCMWFRCCRRCCLSGLL